jgi:hypothetical protein
VENVRHLQLRVSCGAWDFVGAGCGKPVARELELALDQRYQ